MRYTIIMNDVDIAWAAGLFEGEGSFSFQNSGIGTGVALSSTDRDVLERLQALFGGKISVSYNSNEKWKECFKWNLGLKDGSEDFVRAIYPYLCLRRKTRADEWLDTRTKVRQDRDRTKERNNRMLEMLAEGKTQRQVAEEFGVNQSYVSKVVRAS